MSAATPQPQGPTKQVSNWNIANALTVGRIVMVPVCAWALLHAGGLDSTWRWWALVIFVGAMITDRLDGELARSRGLVTDFGKLADPIADKALIGAALLGLSILGDLPWWVTIVVLGRELGVTALRFWVLRHGVIPASRGGKLKTLLQSVAIGLFLLPLGHPWEWVAWGFMIAAVVATVATGIDYVWQAVALRRRSSPGGVQTA